METADLQVSARLGSGTDLAPPARCEPTTQALEAIYLGMLHARLVDLRMTKLRRQGRNMPLQLVAQLGERLAGPRARRGHS